MADALEHAGTRAESLIQILKSQFRAVSRRQHAAPSQQVASWRRSCVGAADLRCSVCAIDTVCDHIEKQAKVPDGWSFLRSVLIDGSALQSQYGGSGFEVYRAHLEARARTGALSCTAMLAAKAKGLVMCTVASVNGVEVETVGALADALGMELGINRRQRDLSSACAVF